MLKVRGYQYIVVARNNLSRVSEGQALKKVSVTKLASFFYEQILCWYKAIGQIVTDNGLEVQGTFEKLMRKYGIS